MGETVHKNMGEIANKTLKELVKTVEETKEEKDGSNQSHLKEHNPLSHTGEKPSAACLVET